MARLELFVGIAGVSAEQAYSRTPSERASCGFLWCCTTVSELDNFVNLYTLSTFRLICLLTSTGGIAASVGVGRPTWTREEEIYKSVVV